jgi:uncharacterized iron-regulated membrane protein
MQGSPGRPREQPLNRAHRISGAIAGVVLVYLIVTGVPLQFTDALGLGGRYVGAGFVHDAYNLTAPERAQRSGRVSRIGDLMIIDGVGTLAVTDAPLDGAVDFGTHIVVALGGELLYIDPRPPLRGEPLDSPLEPARIARSAANTLIVSDGADSRVTSDLMTWQTTTSAAEFATVAALDGAELADAQVVYKSRFITWERWLQDLHSGRFFGAVGQWLVSLSTLIMIGLAATGLVIWSRQRRMKRQLAALLREQTPP